MILELVNQELFLEKNDQAPIKREHRDRMLVNIEKEDTICFDFIESIRIATVIRKLNDIETYE